MKKIYLFTVLITCLASKLFAQSTPLDQFKADKFGMFLHWGLYAQTAGDWKNHAVKGGEHFMLYERIPVNEYATIANQFNPVKFDADAWVKQAKEAGMKYVVFTAKHHDGFAMYNSASSDYNIVKRSPFKCDPIAELAKACKKYQLMLCLYYSLGRDWQDPDVPTNWPVKAGRSNTWDFPNEDAKVFNRYFERKVKPQITELLSNYGPIGVLWFDTPELISKPESAELKALVHKLQPNCLVNNRIGNGLGDFSISEQSLTPSSKKAWESCLTIGKNWGYNRHDSTWKSPEVLIRHLVEVVANGGNLLLNIGPQGDGTFPDWATARLKVIGEWMKTNQEAIYGTHPWLVVKESNTNTNESTSIEASKSVTKDAVFDGTPQSVTPDVYYTAKDKLIYVLLRSWKTPQLVLKQINNQTASVKDISLLGNKKKIKWAVTNQELKLDLPADFKDTTHVPVYVLKITTN